MLTICYIDYRSSARIISGFMPPAKAGFHNVPGDYNPIIIIFSLLFQSLQENPPLMRSFKLWFNHFHRAELLRLFDKRTI
jgi:hypothetical protein